MIVDRENTSADIQNLPDSSFEPVVTSQLGDEAFKTEPIGFFKDALNTIYQKPSVGSVVLVDPRHYLSLHCCALF